MNTYFVSFYYKEQWSNDFGSIVTDFKDLLDANDFLELSYKIQEELSLKDVPKIIFFKSLKRTE